MSTDGVSDNLGIRAFGVPLNNIGPELTRKLALLATD